MDQPIYQFFEWTARESGLLWMTEQYRQQILLFLVLLGFVCCLFGFYFYRGLVSGGVFLCVTLLSYLWIYPRWGERPCVTVCAVVGVVLAFLGYRCFRLGAVMLCAALGGSLVWQALRTAAPSDLALLLCILLTAVFSGIVTFFFPLWSICGFTAVWGSLLFLAEGGRYVKILGLLNGWQAGILGLGMAVIGFLIQMVLFRRQRLFVRIMPRRLEHMLEKRKKAGR